MSFERLIDRLELLTKQVNSLHDRLDARDRVDAELRTEVAASGHELGLLRKSLVERLTRARTRRRVRAAFSEIARARRTA
jgi:hypothetical protein